MNVLHGGKVVTAIDIGTTKICVLIGIADGKGGIEVIGMGTAPSHGLKKGVIVDIGLTVQAIKIAIILAEKNSGLTVGPVVVGISGGHIQSFNSKGVVAIKRRDVMPDDIERVIEAAKAVPIPQDREILQIIPQYFRVDGQENVLDSLGMHGIRLEAQVHIITGAVSSAHNIITACELAGLKVEDIVLEQIASAEAVLTDSERELGVGILDIGGGTSDFALYRSGRIMHSKVIPIAGNHFTNDLAIGLEASLKISEDVKRKYGFVTEESYINFDTALLELTREVDQKVKKVELYRVYQVLNPRAEEVFDFLHEEMMLYHLKEIMPLGLVLTGGGALLRGMEELAQTILDIPIRVGIPFSDSDDNALLVPDSIKSPIYATGYGLLLYAVRGQQAVSESLKNIPIMSRVLHRMKSWIYEYL
ncbi:cell division protein FtsA [Candidatus Babeliales bacterium]|nr:cell division protein FtsA [Candidatus Babeliales bacterium]